MILTGAEILKRIQKGDITITPFEADKLNPNSYNLSIGSELLVYRDAIVDVKQKSNTQTLPIPETGLVLQPGRLYLAKTLEYTETKGLVPVLYGRSSAARSGLFVHASAGLGDDGYKGHWTLSLVATQPTRIYPNMSLAQLVYFKIEGESIPYSGKYQNSLTAVPQKFNEENE